MRNILNIWPIVGSSRWQTIGQACWVAAFPSARAQVLRELADIKCSNAGFGLLTTWWDARYQARRDETGLQRLQQSRLLHPQVAAVHARTIMLDVVHQTRADMWATQHAPLRMEYLQRGADLHRLVVNLVLRQATDMEDLRVRNTDELTPEELWNERTRWIPDEWLPVNACARPATGTPWQA